MLRAALQIVIGTIVSVGLMVAAVMLWSRTLIIFGAPLGVASLAAAWVTIDNVFIYRRSQEAAEPPASSQ